MSASVTLPLHDPALWPLRMTRAEVMHVLRVSRTSLYRTERRGGFPPPDGDGMWARDVIEHYARGGIKRYDQVLQRRARQAQRANTQKYSTSEGA